MNRIDFIIYWMTTSHIFFLLWNPFSSHVLYSIHTLHNSIERYSITNSFVAWIIRWLRRDPVWYMLEIFNFKFCLSLFHNNCIRNKFKLKKDFVLYFSEKKRNAGLHLYTHVDRSEIIIFDWNSKYKKNIAYHFKFFFLLSVVYIVRV